MRVAETVFMVLLSLAVIGVPTAIIWNIISADGRVTACYIREHPRVTDGKSFALKGDVNWREDSFIGWFANQDEARAEATKINCQIIP